MDGYESLEEGEIPSPPPPVVVKRDHDNKQRVSRNSSRVYRPPRKKIKSRAPRNKYEIADFDRMRTKCLERLKQKKILEQEIASKEIEATEIDDVEMEDANVIILGDSEEDELRKLRDVALSSQRSTNRISGEEDKEKTENEFFLRAEALKTAIIKKRPSILRKKNKLNNRKHLLENDSGENVKANKSKTDESCNDRVEIDIKADKENLDNSEINDEEALREQLLASIKTSNKDKSFLVDNVTAEKVNTNDEVTAKVEVKDNLSENIAETIPVITISPIKKQANASFHANNNEVKASESLKTDALSIPIKNNLETGSLPVTNTLLIEKKSIRKGLFGEPPKSLSLNVPLSHVKDLLSHNNNLNVTKTKMLKPKLISKNLRNVPKPNGLAVKKKGKEIKKLPISILVPKTTEQRIVVNIGPDSSDDDVDEPKIHPAPGALMSSIDDFLSNARRLTETPHPTSVPSTPEAVYAHLPPSQRMEYIKLKKQLAEKEESLKLKKNEGKQSIESEQLLSNTLTIANATITSSKQQTFTKIEHITSLPQQTLAKPVSNTSTQQIISKAVGNLSPSTQKVTDKTVANTSASYKQITATTSSSSQQITANIVTSTKPILTKSIGNTAGRHPPLIKKENKIDEKIAIANKIPSPTTKSLNPTKHVKTKTKKETELNINDSNLVEKNNLSVFFKKNVGKNLLPTIKSKNAQQNYLKVNSNITNATQLMHLLKKELILEKNANSELARLKLQVNCAEQKKKVHSTRVSLLRSRIKHLLEASKLPTTEKTDNPKNKEENKKKETADVIINKEGLESSKTLDSPVANKNKVENNLPDDVPLWKKRKTEGSFEDYESPLSKIESDINPLVEFCPHDLTGKCRDPDCQYQHLPPKNVK